MWWWFECCSHFEFLHWTVWCVRYGLECCRVWRLLPRVQANCICCHYIAGTYDATRGWRGIGCVLTRLRYYGGISMVYCLGGGKGRRLWISGTCVSNLGGDVLYKIHIPLPFMLYPSWLQIIGYLMWLLLLLPLLIPLVPWGRVSNVILPLLHCYTGPGWHHCGSGYLMYSPFTPLLHRPWAASLWQWVSNVILPLLHCCAGPWWHHCGSGYLMYSPLLHRPWAASLWQWSWSMLTTSSKALPPPSP